MLNYRLLSLTNNSRKIKESEIRTEASDESEGGRIILFPSRFSALLTVAQRRLRSSATAIFADRQSLW